MNMANVQPMKTGFSIFRTRVLSILALAAALVMPAVASAHIRLKLSNPEAGAHLNVAPREIRLDFSEVPELTFTTLQLVDVSGKAITLSALAYASDSKRSVVATILSALPSGIYTVIWQAASDDGHPMRDRFAFVVAPGGSSAAGEATNKAGTDSAAYNAAMMDSMSHHDAASMPQGTGFGVDSPLYVLLRWTMFIALLLAIGAVAFYQLVLRFLRAKQRADSPMLADASLRAARIGRWAVWGLLIVLALRLLAQSVAMHGAADAFNVALVAAMVQKTMWGHGWLLQLAGIGVAGFGFYRAQTARASSASTRRGWLIATVGVVILAFTPGLAGHAASTPKLETLTLLADTLHVIGAGGWLGSLTIVLLAGIPAALALDETSRAGMVAELINAFSPTALTFAGIVATTGTFAAWIHIGSITGLWETPYGRTLLIKLAVLSLMAATGAYNWLRVKPSLGAANGAARMQRSAKLETVIGLIVLLVTAVLVALPTSMDMTM